MMVDEEISVMQKISCIVMFLFGSTLVLGTGAGAKRDVWLAVIIAILATVPIYILHSKIHSEFMDMDIFDVFIEIFGRYIGKIFIIIYVWFAYQLGGLVLINFIQFISTVGPPKTPTVVWAIIIIGLASYIVKSGIEVLGRWSQLFLILLIFLITTITLLSTTKLDFNHLRPVLYNGIQPVLKGAFSSFSFPFGEVVVFTMILSGFKEKKLPAKVYLISLSLGGFFILLISFRNIMVLGESSFTRVYFPSYLEASRINIGETLQRVEIVVSIAFLSSGFVKISVCLLAACRGISKLFSLKDYRFIVIPIGLMMINFAFSSYDSIMEARRWAFMIWPYYAFPFQVIIPAITLIGIRIKSNFTS